MAGGEDMMNKRGVVLCALLAVAAAVRFTGLNWDGGIGAHPDERYVVGAAEALHWPERWNPFAVEPGFAYGHLPLYLLSLAHSGLPGVDALLLGRALAALFDLGLVGLVFLLGRQVYGASAGLWGAAFVAVMPLHVQQAHFYTADSLLACCCVGTLLCAARLAEKGGAVEACLAGVWAGLALGVKFSAALLALPLGAACAIMPGHARARRRWALWVVGTAAAAFLLTNPFAFLSFPTFWGNIWRESAIARGALDAPYTRQFAGTWPYLYPLAQQLRWGMGWIPGLVACGGLAYAVRQAVRRPPGPGEWVLLAWMLPGLAFTGALYAKFPRYLLPFTPLLALCAARALVDWYRCRRRLSVFLTVASLGYSFLTCGAILGAYALPHPFRSASEWFYAHVPPGAAVAVEAWDHPLPLDATDYHVLELPIFDAERAGKWERIESILTQADYVIIASQRGYGALGRHPDAARYYRRLFGGELGFRPAACFVRVPRLGPLVLSDDPAAGLSFSLPELCRPDAPFMLQFGRLDESFTVYDRPVVIVFRR